MDDLSQQEIPSPSTSVDMSEFTVDETPENANDQVLPDDDYAQDDDKGMPIADVMARVAKMSAKGLPDEVRARYMRDLQATANGFCELIGIERLPVFGVAKDMPPWIQALLAGGIIVGSVVFMRREYAAGGEQVG